MIDFFINRSFRSG